MKVYRGPKTLPFWDNRHEVVAEVEPQKLEASLRDGSYIRFNISKDAACRRAICTARFDADDVVPMISGLLSRLAAQQAAIGKIKDVTLDSKIEPLPKLKQIEKLLDGV